MARNVTVIEQSDRSFGVLLDNDNEGAFDRLYPWGPIDDDTVITKGEAREAAMDYAEDLAKRFGGKVVNG